MQQRSVDAKGGKMGRGDEALVAEEKQEGREGFKDAKCRILVQRP